MTIQVPDVLHPGNPWLRSASNREQLEKWVNQYNLTLANIQVLTFTPVGIEAVIQVRDEDGKLIVEGRGIVRTEVVKKKYKKGTKPKVMKEGRVWNYERAKKG